MIDKITPGRYRNTNTSAEFNITLDEEADEVIFSSGEGKTKVEFRKDAGNFWFNTLEATGPTYELIEPAETETTEDVRVEA